MKFPAFSFAAAVEENMARKQKATMANSKKAEAGPSLLQTPPPSTNYKRKHAEKLRRSNNVTVDLTNEDGLTYQDDQNGPLRAFPPQHKTHRPISPQSPIEERHRRTPNHLQQSPSSPVKLSQGLGEMPSLLESALKAPGPARKQVESLESQAEDVNARKRKADGRASPHSPKRQATEQESQNSPVDSPRSPIEESAPKKAAAKLLETAPLTQNVGDRDPRVPVESPRSPVEETMPQGSDVQQTHIRPLRQGVDSAAVLTIETPSSLGEETISGRHRISATPTSPAPPEAINSPTEPDIPTTETSSRFIPTSRDGISYRDPRRFSLKPPFWRAWTPSQYIAFAESLRLQFDPIPFAQESGLPVEEITSVFHAVVVNPLYFAKEAKKRGEEGMQDQMELFQAKKYATPRRYWGKGEGKEWKVFGELKGVEVGRVELVSGREGNRVVLGVRELSEADSKYLVDNLRKEDRALLVQDVLREMREDGRVSTG